MGEGGEVAVAVPDGNAMFEGDGGDQAIYRGADREALGATKPVEVGGGEEGRRGQRIAEDGESQEVVAEGEGLGAGAQPLQDFLQHRPAGGKVGELAAAQGRTRGAAQPFDPD